MEEDRFGTEERQKREAEKQDSYFWVNGGAPYLVSGDEMPEHFADTCCVINRAVWLPEAEFSLHARILAALHLAEITAEWENCVGEMPYCLAPEALSVNPKNGEIGIRIEAWRRRPEDSLSEKGSAGEERRRDCFLRYQAKPDGEEITEAELFRFTVYVTFRILCVEDPFDGSETLIRYPYLSGEAMEEIHHREAAFIFSDSANRCSDYIGKTASEKWSALPGFVKRTFQRALDGKDAVYEKSVDRKDWLMQMRKLRDCLVYVNRQFKLCDPEEPNQVLFLETGDFKIPVWVRKAVYWYHVGAAFEEQTKGIVGGIMQEGFLENRSSTEWIVEAGRRKLLLHPGESIRLEKGMKIEAEDTLISVVDGEMA